MNVCICYGVCVSKQTVRRALKALGHKNRLLIDREDGDQLLYFILILSLWK